MASNFVLKDTVDELTYDFTPQGGTGTIPEPSAVQITAFRKSIAEVMSDSMGEETNIQEGSTEWAKRVIEVLGKDTSEIQEKILHAVADVCSDKPSFDDLSALPYRAQQAFNGWVMGVFLLPSTPTPDTNS